MSDVVFENEGILDIRGITTFGISAKNNKNPIGYFGTGLKYALAICLRHKLKVKIIAGENTYIFDTAKIEMRGKEFEVVTMNGNELPFTTELGKNWKLWQAFRELYCNALDESGRVYKTRRSQNKVNPDSQSTKIIIQGDVFEKCYAMKDDIVLDLPADKLVFKNQNVEAYKKINKHIYYRGIRVHDFDKKSMLTYNILHRVDLTEDRTLKYSFDMTHAMLEVVAGLTDKDLIRDILLNNDGYTEETTFYIGLANYENIISDEFLEVLSEEYNKNNDKLNTSARSYFMERFNKTAAKNYEKVDTSDVEKLQLEKCKKVCRALFPDFDDYNIMIVKNLGMSTMALADRKTQTMVISQRCFHLGTKYLTATMIEEYAHLKFGYNDLTREFQTWLFDTICTITENHVIKEPI